MLDSCRMLDELDRKVKYIVMSIEYIVRYINVKC